MYTYGLSSGPSMAQVQGAAIFSVVFTILAILVIIGATVFGCIYFLGKKSDPDNAGTRFFNFDTLYLERILKVFNVFCSVVIAVTFIFTPFGMLIGGMVGGGDFWAVLIGFIITLLICAVLFFLFELLNRIAFEYAILFIRMGVDIRSIRNGVRTIAGTEEAIGEGQDSFFDDVKSMFNRTKDKAESEPKRGYDPQAQQVPQTGYHPQSWSPAVDAAPTSTQAPVAERAPYSAQSAAYQQAPSVEAVESVETVEVVEQAAPSGAATTAQAKARAIQDRNQFGTEQPTTPTPRVTDEVIESAASEAWICPSCGNENIKGKFCAKCGTRRS